MQSLFWLLANRTAETQFIFNLFHLLLAGLTLLVLLHQLRRIRAEGAAAHYWLMTSGFLLLVFHFSLLALYFGIGFFFRKELGWASFERLSHSLLACGFLVVIAAYAEARSNGRTRLAKWLLSGCAVIIVAALIDILQPLPQVAAAERVHSLVMLVADVLVLLAVGVGLEALLQGERAGQRAGLIALVTVGLFFLLHGLSLLLPQQTEVLAWNAGQHLLSIALFAFAWAAGERSGHLLDRIFVRLNLTFIILASLIMLITAGMEKYQYLRLAEERSTDLAEFLRGHIIYYRVEGESLEKILQRPDVLRRVVVEFGTLRELREIDIYLDGQRASFRYTPEWEVKEEITAWVAPAIPAGSAGLGNSFRMIHLPIENGANSENRIEFLGTMDYINEYIGKYIILIYSLFTLMVGLATGIVGIIVADTDRQLRRQYGELEETHQQLAQAAKLASVGQLAGGTAHEINNPITSILSLASHMVEDKEAGTLTLRQRRNLQVIAQQAQRVSKIVKNLLTFSRQVRLELSEVDIGELLETALTLMHYRLRESGIQIRREIDTDLPFVLGDVGCLTEVLVNLLNNAIDAMPNGGALVVRAILNSEANGGGVRVEIADSGCGIPSEDLPRIFDPFFTTKEPGHGTGLGLSTTHGIVKDHGGQIWAESQLGTGTTLVVTLPREGGGNARAYPDRG